MRDPGGRVENELSVGAFRPPVAAFSAAPVLAMPSADPWRPTWLKRVGNPTDPNDRDVLAKASPSGLVDRFKAPLLVGYGANDGFVKPSEVEQLLNALAKKNVSVGLVTYGDEARTFSRLENRLDFWARVDAFLARECLGGRSEPLPSEGRVPGSTAVAKGNATGSKK